MDTVFKVSTLYCNDLGCGHIFPDIWW